MKAVLYIIVDVSGSMKEMGKIHLQRNLCRYATQLRFISQEKYSGLNIRFYQWTQSISEIVLQSDGDIPALNAKGISKLSVLSDFLSQELNDTGKSLALILSEGNFDHDDYKVFLGWKKDHKLPLIRTVAIGADANLMKLKEISSNNTVFLSENIASAIDCTIFGFDEPLAAPASTAQILQSEQAFSKELKEDWDA